MRNPVVMDVFLVLRLGIGLLLLRLALNPKYRNLHWLAAVFYLNFIALFLRGQALGSAAQALMVVIQICLAMFTHTTFYRHRRSPVGWMIGALIVGGGLSFYRPQHPTAYAGLVPMQLMSAANWSWHGLVAWQVWRKLRLDRSIEDWVKTRYVIVVTYALAMAALFLLQVSRTGVPFLGWVWTATFIVALVLQYLAWGMPAFLRNYLNRNYRPSAATAEARDMTEEEVLRALEKQRAG
jgi:hypothetical protein